MLSDSSDCDCEFDSDPNEPDDPDGPWHFRRTCAYCHYVWYGLHCPHDGYQNPCPRCDLLPGIPLEGTPEAEARFRAFEARCEASARAWNLEQKQKYAEATARMWRIVFVVAGLWAIGSVLLALWLL